MKQCNFVSFGQIDIVLVGGESLHWCFFISGRYIQIRPLFEELSQINPVLIGL